MCSLTFQPAHRVQDDRSLGSRRAPHSDTAAEFECSLASIQALLAQNCQFLFQDAVSGLSAARRDLVCQRGQQFLSNLVPPIVSCSWLLQASHTFQDIPHRTHLSSGDSDARYYLRRILLNSRYRYVSDTSRHSLQTRSRGVRYH